MKSFEIVLYKYFTFHWREILAYTSLTNALATLGPAYAKLNDVGGWISLVRFLSLARSKLMLCSTNHRAGYVSNMACDWLSIVWVYFEQGTENRPWTENILNRHQTIFQTFPNFFLNLTLPGVPHLYKQLPNGQYLSDLCKMCNLDANLWKRWIGDHRILTYIFKWERLNTAGHSHSVSIGHWVGPCIYRPFVFRFSIS